MITVQCVDGEKVVDFRTLKRCGQLAKDTLDETSDSSFDLASPNFTLAMFEQLLKFSKMAESFSLNISYPLKSKDSMYHIVAP